MEFALALWLTIDTQIHFIFMIRLVMQWQKQNVLKLWWMELWAAIRIKLYIYTDYTGKLHKKNNKTMHRNSRNSKCRKRKSKNKKQNERKKNKRKRKHIIGYDEGNGKEWRASLVFARMERDSLQKQNFRLRLIIAVLSMVIVTTYSIICYQHQYRTGLDLGYYFFRIGLLLICVQF